MRRQISATFYKLALVTGLCLVALSTQVHAAAQHAAKSEHEPTADAEAGAAKPNHSGRQTGTESDAGEEEPAARKRTADEHLPRARKVLHKAPPPEQGTTATDEPEVPKHKAVMDEAGTDEAAPPIPKDDTKPHARVKADPRSNSTAEEIDAEGEDAEAGDAEPAAAGASSKSHEPKSPAHVRSAHKTAEAVVDDEVGAAEPPKAAHVHERESAGAVEKPHTQKPVPAHSAEETTDEPAPQEHKTAKTKLGAAQHVQSDEADGHQLAAGHAGKHAEAAPGAHPAQKGKAEVATESDAEEEPSEPELAAGAKGHDVAAKPSSSHGKDPHGTAAQAHGHDEPNASAARDEPEDATAEDSKAHATAAKSGHASSKESVNEAKLASNPDTVDLRVLIDVSGSMKETDPENLRVPALKLLAELLPPEGRAGIWAFGKSAEVLVPNGATDKVWKGKALAAVNKIHSKDQLTNIELALTKSTSDWGSKPAENRARQVILLTDGKVDVGKDPALNKASQDRLLNELLPRLRKLGVKVHTIALSEAADQALLQQLAGASDGSFELAADAGQLQRVFLHMFEHAAPRDTLPLKHNRFQVDANVDELTLLVFRKKPESRTSVILPDEQELDAETKLPGLRWHHEDQYDLVTFSKPPVGEWRIKAASDPDNRAMIVTNLKLKLNKQPSNIVLGEELDLAMNFTAAGEPMTDRRFLDLVAVGGARLGEDKAKTPFEFKGPNKSGVYKVTIADELKDGKNDVLVTAKSPTFERERRFEVEAFAHPVDVVAKPVTDKGHSGYAVEFIPKPGLLDLEGAELSVTIIDQQGKPHTVEVQPPTPEGWHLMLQNLDGRKVSVRGKITATTLRGQEMEFETAPLALPLEQIPAEDPAEEAKPEPEAPPEPVKPPEPASAAVPADGTGGNWLIDGSALLIANALFGLGGYFGYKWFKRRNAKAMTTELAL